MCGIIGILCANPDNYVNQLMFDALTVLQHRGQDAAGMVTVDPTTKRLNLRKENGLVKDVFQAHHMQELIGSMGIGHVRYPTAGSSSCAEAQPLYTNYPYGICVAHNGNITNTSELYEKLTKQMHRHCNTDSDSELLLNLFASYLLGSENDNKEMPDRIFDSMDKVMEECRGGYAGIYLINGVGLVGFRDPHGIRPLVVGCRPSSLGCGKMDYAFASESVAIDALGFDLMRSIKPAEAFFIDMKTGEVKTKLCHPEPRYTPCIFEYVYFARPDSIMDGVSVYESRLRMGELLAGKIIKKYPDHDIDVVIPIPDTSRTSALQAAYVLGRPFREGFIKNRYIARTFIMPGQETRKKSVRLKLNTIKSEFAGRNVLLVDDSIVRGTTAREIVQMARDAGAKKVYFSSAAPPIRYPNIYGIDIPTRKELVAYERDEEDVAKHIGADWIVYQDLEDLTDSVKLCESTLDEQLTEFETSCFSGTYVTGETIDSEYFQKLHELRNDDAKLKRGSSAVEQPKSKPVSQSGFNEGCESLTNNLTEGNGSVNVGCEGLTNNNSSFIQ